MHFVIYALDKPGSGAVRAAHREAHRNRLVHHDHPVKVVAAGPLLDVADAMIGSLIIIEAAAIGLVKTFLAGDPYQLNGLFASVDIRPFRWTIGAPPAG